jgi:hypothetical protein
MCINQWHRTTTRKNPGYLEIESARTNIDPTTYIVWQRPRLPKIALTQAFVRRKTVKPLRNRKPNPSKNPPEYKTRTNSKRIRPTHRDLPTISPQKSTNPRHSDPRRPPTEPAPDRRGSSPRRSQAKTPSRARREAGPQRPCTTQPAASRRSHSRPRRGRSRRPPSHRPRAPATAAPPFTPGMGYGPTAHASATNAASPRRLAAGADRGARGDALGIRVWCRRGEQRDAQRWGGGRGVAGKGRCESGGGFSREGY